MTCHPDFAAGALSQPRAPVRHEGMTLHSIVHNVSDLASAKAIQAALLGVAPHTDQPYYVGFNVGGVEVGLAPLQPGQPWAPPVANWATDDLDGAVARLQDAGATLVGEPRQVAPGVRVALLNDKDGNPLGLIESTA